MRHMEFNKVMVSFFNDEDKRNRGKEGVGWEDEGAHCHHLHLFIPGAKVALFCPIYGSQGSKVPFSLHPPPP